MFMEDILYSAKSFIFKHWIAFISNTQLLTSTTEKYINPITKQWHLRFTFYVRCCDNSLNVFLENWIIFNQLSADNGIFDKQFIATRC